MIRYLDATEKAAMAYLAERKIYIYIEIHLYDSLNIFLFKKW